MKPAKIEPIMSSLEDFFMESSHSLIKSVQEERFEEACKVRDNIEDKILQIHGLLLKRKLTKIEPESLLELLLDRKNEYIRSWEEILEVPNDRRITF